MFIRKPENYRSLDEKDPSVYVKCIGGDLESESSPWYSFFTNCFQVNDKETTLKSDSLKKERNFRNSTNNLRR